LQGVKERKADIARKREDNQHQAMRKWLYKRRLEGRLAFTNAERTSWRKCFNQLDSDGGGSIGVDELVGPLIGLGFADSREEVEEIVREVDEDGSGMIEFDEFLLIIKNSDSNEKTAKIHTFFKNMSNGTLGNRDLSFNVLV